MTKNAVQILRRRDENADRQVYDITTSDERKLIAILTTDAVTVLGKPRGKVKYRGQICTAIAEYFLNATDDIVPNFLAHMPEESIHPNVLFGEYCKPMQVKFIARRYLTGSLYDAYIDGEGVTPWGRLDKGLPHYYLFKDLMLTPMMRIIGGEYRPMLESDVVASGAMKPDDLEYVREKCTQLFVRGEFLASKAGLVLADTKFEFGWDARGRIMLIDELLTPDCSRYWQSRDTPFSDENPPISETSSEFLSMWVRRQAEKLGVETDEVVVPAKVRSEAYAMYSEIYRQLLDLTFVPVKPPRSAERALKYYVLNNF